MESGLEHEIAKCVRMFGFWIRLHWGWFVRPSRNADLEESEKAEGGYPELD